MNSGAATAADWRKSRPDLFFARSIYTVQPRDATFVTTAGASARDTRRIVHVRPPLNLVSPFEISPLRLLASRSTSPPRERKSCSNLLPVIPFNSSSHRNGGRETRQSCLSRSSCTRNTTCRLLFALPSRVIAAR